VPYYIDFHYLTAVSVKAGEVVQSHFTALSAEIQTSTNKHGCINTTETERKIIMEILANANFTTIDKMNVLVSAQDIKKLKDTNLTITGVFVYNTPDKETGEAKMVGAVKTPDGTIYGFTSATLIECALMLASAFNDDEYSSIEIQVISGQSKSDRTFYQFKVLSLNK
jgi:hypothetical protein